MALEDYGSFIAILIVSVACKGCCYFKKRNSKYCSHEGYKRKRRVIANDTTIRRRCLECLYLRIASSQKENKREEGVLRVDVLHV